jgi:hypothetical protein
MHVFAAAGAAFLLAVLWFDLMFDVQTRRYAGAVPGEILESIASYYRRVTTDATPMNRLVSIVMVLTLGVLVAEILENRNPPWLEWGSLACAASAVGLAAVRTVRNAVTLGAGSGSAEERSALARAIWRDHLFCLAAIVSTTVLQIAAR